MNREEATAFVIRELGKHRGPEDITRELSMYAGCSWPEAEEFVNRVRFQKRTTIAARQAPLLLFLGIVTLIIGIAISGYSGYGIAYLISNDYIPSTRIIGVFLTGLAMIGGSSIGLVQCVRSMFR
jgi:hypothetical protein